VTFTNQSNLRLQQINLLESDQYLYDQDVTGYPNAVEVALLDEFAIFKETGETSVIVRDRRLREIVRRIETKDQNRLNFKIIRRDT
jgi:hypothetical protein